MITKRWSYVRNGIIYSVYSNEKPNIVGVYRSGFWDYDKGIVVSDELCDYRAPNQFQETYPSSKKRTHK